MAHAIEHHTEDARVLLQRILDRQGWNASDLARLALLSHTTLTRFLGNPSTGAPPSRGLGTQAALKVWRTLITSGVDRRLCDAFLAALDQPVLHHAHDMRGAAPAEPAPREASNASIELPSETLAKAGVSLASYDRASEAFTILRPLVAPNTPRGVLLDMAGKGSSVRLRIAAAVASAHLGQCYITRHDPDQARDAYEQALRLYDDISMQRGVAPLWEPWQAIMGRSPKDFELWCHQQLGVALRMSGNRHAIHEASGRLRYVIQEAPRGQFNPSAMRGNALRDMAMAKIVVNPASSEAGQHLDASIDLLREVDAGAMVAISLLKRAGWHKAQGQWREMDRDALEGLEMDNNAPGVVPINIITTAAEVYADLDPTLAEQLAHMARTRALTAGYEGQRDRADAVLQALNRGH